MNEPRQPLDWFDRLVVPTLGYVAATVMFCLMALTCVDVFGRYLLNSPIWGGFELTEMLLAVLIFAGLPLVSLRNDHVTVDLFDPVTPDWLFRIQHVVACAIGFACMGYLAWRLWLRAEHMLRAGETTAQLKIKLGYLTFSMSVLMAFAAIALLVLAFRRPQRHFVEEGSA
jgi:TRAP-type C4-dicarboxylate transport system permease small subunit